MSAVEASATPFIDMGLLGEAAAVTAMIGDHAASVAKPRQLIHLQERDGCEMLLQRVLAVNCCGKTLQRADRDRY